MVYSAVDSKARVRPALDEIDAVLVDLASLLEDLEEGVAKGVLELAEVDLGMLVEVALAVEDSRGHQSVKMGVMIEKTAERLRRGEEGGDRTIEVGEPALEILPNDPIGRTAEVAVQPSVVEERGTDDLGNREDERRVRNLGEHLLDMRSAHSMARRLPQLGHSPRALHEYGSSRSCPQPSQSKRRKPKWRSPQRRNRS